MIVTGHQLKSRIRALELQLKVASAVFDNALYAFEGEDKDLLAAATALDEMESAICTLQTAQADYNLRNHLDDGLSLTFAVKRLGSLSRLEKKWREALPKRDRYSSVHDQRREKGEEIASLSMPAEEIAQRAFLAGNEVASLTARVAAANGLPLDISWLQQLP